MQKYKKQIIIAIVVVLIVGSVLFQNQKDNPRVEENAPNVKDSSDQCIWVDVKGAVYKPNIYCVKKDSMLEEIIIIAGGFHYNADLSTINRVSKISHETMIVIPYTKEIENKKISINTATVDELMKVPFIGESKAIAIIEYRTKTGRFMKLDDITKVSGIGNETYLKIKDYISL